MANVTQIDKLKRDHVAFPNRQFDVDNLPSKHIPKRGTWPQEWGLFVSIYGPRYL